MEKMECFVNNTFSELEEANRNPIFGYEDSLVLTLEEAVEKIGTPIFDGINHVAIAQQKCNRQSSLLTQDESAAIYLYSMATPLFSSLNKTLRAENRHELKPWFAFLKLLMTALKKLPSTKKTIWRGIAGDFDPTLLKNGTHIWWSVNSFSTALDAVELFLGNKGTLIAIEAIDGKDISAFSAFSTEKEIVLMPGTQVRAVCKPLNFISCLRVIHMEEINQNKSQSNYLFELVKQKYQRNSRIERIMNPSKSYPIQQSYINLSIISAKEQYEKEKQLRDAQHGSNIIRTFEEIYGTKTPIDIKNIFDACKNQEKQVLVFGRAGIGKSTCCRYVAYQWATNGYWSQFELLALIPLRRLTIDRYPSDKSYSLLDIVKKEVFQIDLTDKEEQLLKERFDLKKTLWILDGYDEIVQNVPSYLKYLFEQLLQTPHHILTSRPYMITLSYDVQIEITGFTDENIMQYVQQFFDQMKGELDDAPIKSQRLLNFLRRNSNIWGVAHIPVNLELIASVWSNEDLPEISKLTITTLYTTMIEWLCRRYLTSQNVQIQNLRKNELNRHCRKELAFLENLAFTAMEHNAVIIRPFLLEKALDETEIYLMDHPHVLNIGILKSFNKQGVGTQIETDKDHYFVHLSFQEYFAARYLINTIKQCPTQKVIEFIKYQKYNQRYALVFTFAAGILSESDPKTCLDIFWDNILGEPLDLIGAQHMQLIFTCIEETYGKSTFPQRTQLLERIANCIKYSFYNEHQVLREYLLQLLSKAQSVVCDQIITNVFVDLLQDSNTNIHVTVLKFMSRFSLYNPSIALIMSVVAKLEDNYELVRASACLVLGLMGEKAATSDIINKLVNAIGDECKDVRSSACQALSIMGEKVVTNEVISKLAGALKDEHSYVRWSACYTLNQIGKKAVTDDIISKLMVAIVDDDSFVRRMAYDVLKKMSGAAAQNQVISALMTALEDGNEKVRINACNALNEIGEKVATNEIVDKLISVLEHDNTEVRYSACDALSKIRKKIVTKENIIRLINARRTDNQIVRLYVDDFIRTLDESTATSEVINELTNLLKRSNVNVKMNVCQILGCIGEKAATDEVVNKLTAALGDEDVNVRINAFHTLTNMGEKAATDEIISKLTIALGDENVNIRINAFRTLANMGEKAATDDIIGKLTAALEDENINVRLNACEILRNSGNKAVTDEVTSKLVVALGNDTECVRLKAAFTLDQMGEKATTKEVISKILTVLEDENEDVRCFAWQLLYRAGQKAVTEEIISKILTLIESDKDYLRRSACVALLNMGDKARTHEAISKLLTALRDKNENVRLWACRALGKISENVVANEIISGLLNALADENDGVRMSACEVLGEISKKTTTNEIINVLIDALGDENKDIRQCACRVLGKMGEKAVRNEVISGIANMVSKGNDWLNDSHNAAWAVANILSSSDALKQLDPKIISSLCLSKEIPDWLGKLPSNQLIIIFSITQNRQWLLPIFQFLFLRGAAVTISESKVVLYDRDEPLELSVPIIELRQHLIEDFTNQRKNLHLYFEALSEV